MLHPITLIYPAAWAGALTQSRTLPTLLALAVLSIHHLANGVTTSITAQWILPLVGCFFASIAGATITTALGIKSLFNLRKTRWDVLLYNLIAFLAVVGTAVALETRPLWEALLWLLLGAFIVIIPLWVALRETSEEASRDSISKQEAAGIVLGKRCPFKTRSGATTFIIWWALALVFYLPLNFTALSPGLGAHANLWSQLISVSVLCIYAIALLIGFKAPCRYADKTKQ